MVGLHNALGASTEAIEMVPVLLRCRCSCALVGDAVVF